MKNKRGYLQPIGHVFAECGDMVLLKHFKTDEHLEAILANYPPLYGEINVKRNGECGITTVEATRAS